MDSSSNEVPLFGGAITAELPKDWLDVSHIRQVPDNQEVYIANDASDASVIIEVLEPPEGVDDAGIADYLFRDLAEAGDASASSVTSTQQLTSAEVPCIVSLEGIVAYELTGTMTVSKFNESRSSASNEVAVAMGVIRLPTPIETDLLITVNAPIQISSNSSSSATVEEERPQSNPELSMQVLRQVLRTLQIQDFSLFAGEEQE